MTAARSSDPPTVAGIHGETAGWLRHRPTPDRTGPSHNSFFRNRRYA
ncbi:MAG: hypothetical protein JRJ68_00445 [Deltaproteobacteria bacterium]|nr:hypothetical protein [Deltaproteobacteria bacterium]